MSGAEAASARRSRVMAGWTLAEFLVAQALLLVLVAGALALGAGLLAHGRVQALRQQQYQELQLVDGWLAQSFSALQPAQAVSAAGQAPAVGLQWCAAGFAGLDEVCRGLAPLPAGAPRSWPSAGLTLRHHAWAPHWRDGQGVARDILGQDAGAVAAGSPGPLLRTRWQFQPDAESGWPALQARGSGHWAQSQPVAAGVTLMAWHWWLDDGAAGTTARPGWRQCESLAAQWWPVAPGGQAGGTPVTRIWAVRWVMQGSSAPAGKAALPGQPIQRSRTVRLPQPLVVTHQQCASLQES